MKKYIILRLIILVLVITGTLLSVGSFVMLHTAYIGFHRDASLQIGQIEKILAENDETAKQLQDELKSDFLIRAKAAAYMIQYNQDIIYDIEQLEHITELLQIDEIHLFTPEGEIYSGNIPEYYGFTINSGEQMHFFAPMLYDYQLELVQDVTPNTAEGKEMQYVAVWSEDRQHIVQIGIEPLRLIEAMAATDLSYIFSRLTPSANTTFFTVDATTNNIISTTDSEISGLNLVNLGLVDFNEEDIGSTFNAKINGAPGHVLILQQSENIYIGYFENHFSVYGPTLLNICLLIITSLVVAALIITLIYFMLDRVVLSRLLEIENGISLIASGKLEHKMEVTGLPEFELLCNNVNFMVGRVVESSRKFSTIFEHLNIPIAMYECKSDAVIAIGKLAEILNISEDHLTKNYKSPAKFLSFIEEVMSHPYEEEDNLYILYTEDGNRYLKIMRYQEENIDWGIIIDSTDEINEKNIIRKERDSDFLTGLFGKRAFFNQLDSLSQRLDLVKNSAVVMFDLDNLKYVNDSWGHATGDKFIKAAANVLDSCNHSCKISARLSGDEFAMFLYGVDNNQQLSLLIEGIKEQLNDTYIKTPTGAQHRVSASIGYALFPLQSSSIRGCLNLADKAMYLAKSKSKGSIEKYNPIESYDFNITERE